MHRPTVGTHCQFTKAKHKYFCRSDSDTADRSARTNTGKLNSDSDCATRDCVTLIRRYPVISFLFDYLDITCQGLRQSIPTSTCTRTRSYELNAFLLSILLNRSRNEGMKAWECNKVVCLTVINSAILQLFVLSPCCFHMFPASAHYMLFCIITLSSQSLTTNLKPISSYCVIRSIYSLALLCFYTCRIIVN